LISTISTRGRARAVVASAGHDGRGLRRAAPLGRAGTLATRMGPAHQKSYRRASSDALLALSRHRGGRFAARSKAPQEQLHIAAAAALPLQRYAAAQVEVHIFFVQPGCITSSKYPTSQFAVTCSTWGDNLNQNFVKESSVLVSGGGPWRVFSGF
jgi:hypothetical protein